MRFFAARLVLLLCFAIICPSAAAAEHEDACITPTWREAVPIPVYADAEMLDLYNKTWELAAGRVRRGPEGLPATPYLDENCYEDQIWIWDTCFMALFAKYAPGAFPVAESLENLYRPLYENSPTPLKIHFADNPPLFAWVERELYDYTGDRTRADKLLHRQKYLQRHFEWFSQARRGEKLACAYQATHLQAIGHEGFVWSGRASGMDNTPRGRPAGGYDHILWVDALAQQALSARCIAELERELGQEGAAQEWEGRFNRLCSTLNARYWDAEDGFYYDIGRESRQPCRVKTIASYWVMLAGAATAEQADRMVAQLMDPAEFGGDYPAVSLARSDPDHAAATGDYWRGGIWLPMVYMSIKALERYGYEKEADLLAERVLRLQLDTYKNTDPHTIWECYSPSAAAPSTEHGQRVRPDFCGWSALGPIALFIEHTLGFRRVSAAHREVYWRLMPEKGSHGLRNLRFGHITTDIIFDGLQKISVRTNAAYTLIINGTPYPISPGENELKLMLPTENEVGNRESESPQG